MNYLSCPSCGCMMAYNRHDEPVTCKTCGAQQREEVVYCIGCNTKYVIKAGGYWKERVKEKVRK